MSEWTITFEGDEYEPVPPSWLDHPAAVDASQGEGPRLFASAVSTGPGKTLQIRYASPALKRVGICQTAGESHNGGLVPRALLWENPWPRSIKASVLTPQDARRGTEIAYLQDVWTGRDAWEGCVDVPASDEPAVVCPRCEAEHKQGAYRCDECGKDLVDVHAEEDERRLVADGGQSQNDTERKSVTLNLTYQEAKLVVSEMNHLLEGSCENDSVRDGAQSVVDKVARQIPVYSLSLGTENGGQDDE